MKLILAPKYYENFQCIGSACEDTCCSNWDINIEKNVYKKYQKINNIDLKERLKKYTKRNKKSNNDYNYAEFILNENGYCNLMTDDGLCRIQKVLGESYLCNTCAVYPRQSTLVGDFVEKSLTLSCPEAARKVLLNPEGIDFIEMKGQTTDVRDLIYSVVSLEEHPFFWDIRAFCIELIQNREHSIEIRLVLLGFFLKKIESLEVYRCEQDLFKLMQDFRERIYNIDYINSLKDINGNTFFLVNLFKNLIDYRASAEIKSKKYKDILIQVESGLGFNSDSNNIEEVVKNYSKAFNEYYYNYIKNHEYVLENYIVNYIFKNLFPNNYSSVYESYTMLVIHFMLIKSHLIGIASYQNKLNDEIVIECIQQISKTIEHTPVYLRLVCDSLEKSKYTTMGHMFVLINS